MKRLACVYLLSASAVVAAQDAERSEPTEDFDAICTGQLQQFSAPAFELFDRNGDQVITPGEASRCEALDLVYGRLDLDADESLTRAEYRSFADVWSRRLRTFGNDAL